MRGRGTEGISVVSRGGTLLHAPVGGNPPLGGAVTGTPGVPIACRGAATALSGVASVDGAISHTLAALPAVAKIRKARGSRQVCHWGRLPMRSGGPHAEPPPPASIFRFFMRLSFPMRFRGLPTHGPPPHTVSRFPHTTTRLTYFPICHGRSPIARPSPHTIHKLQKSDFHFGEISGSSSTNPNQPCQANTLDLRYLFSKSHANQVTQILHTCDGGGAGTYARTATGMYAHICTMVILARPCARLHGHGHTFTGMRTRTAKCIHSRVCAHGHGASHFTETSVRRRRSPTNPAKQTSRTCVTSPRIYASNLSTQKPWGAWAWRRFATL